MVTNVLDVRCTTTVKGLCATDRTADRYALLLLYVVVAVATASTATSSAEADEKCTAEEVFGGSGLFKQRNCKKINK